jgi:hypothetical protein
VIKSKFAAGSAQLKTMTRRRGQIGSLGETERELAAEKVEERGDAADQFGKIPELKALKADRLTRPGNLPAR